MARDQMLQPFHLRHPTRGLDSLHVRAKPTLPHLRWAQLLRTIDFLRDIRNLVGFAADETEQRCGEQPANLGQVHALQSVAVGAQR
jgi:hypothetical protein